MVSAIISEAKGTWEKFRFFVQDESRFGRITSVGRSWCPFPGRPEAKEQIVREYTYAYSAVAPHSGESVSLILPYANTYCMEIFLRELSDQFPDSMNIIQLDGASFYKGHQMKIPSNIKLLFQPPYSPQVNPIENLWDYIKENYYRNRSFESMHALEDDLCSVFSKIQANTKRLSSITSFPWIMKMNLNAT